MKSIFMVAIGFESEIPEELCPICSLSIIKNDTLLSYILTKHNINIDDIQKEIRDKFDSLTELDEYLLKENGMLGG